MHDFVTYMTTEAIH